MKSNQNPDPTTPETAFPAVEILAPAGTEDMMKAAVENGADAVYFGLQAFNARLRAANFGLDELPRILAWLHERGVKAYVTLNTLIFCSELEEAAAVLRRCVEAGVDAVLVQDLGFAALANAIAPELPLHASTQMTVTCAESVDGLAALGLRFDRIIAARELSRRELRKMIPATGVEIEVFIHGALCVAYSGQCLTSEALGGRSANRGECAQACRLPYDLVVDGETRDLGDVRYLLSPKDLAAYEDIPELIDIGIRSLKIEGRLKTPQYVAATVQMCRQAVEMARKSGAVTLDRASRDKLAMTFSRGFTGGYLHAIDHQEVVEGRFPKKRGLYLGRVAEVSPRGVRVKLEGPLKPGDGVVFDAGRPDLDEEGGRVYELFDARGGRVAAFDPPDNVAGLLSSKTKELAADEHRCTPMGIACGEANAEGRVLWLTFGDGRIDPTRVRPGDRVWKTSDPRLDADLTASYEGEIIRYHRPVRAVVRGAAGRPLVLELEDWEGHRVVVEDTESAVAARNRPLTREVLMEQLGRMGNTPFVLESVAMDIDGAIMVPLSRLNDLRRRAVEALIEKRRGIGQGRVVVEGALTALRPVQSAAHHPLAATSRLSVLCRTLAQVEAAASHPGVDTIYTDFEDIRLHREARRLIPGPSPTGPRFVPASLRVVKPGEAPFVRKLLEADPDAVLVRNLSGWAILRKESPSLPVIGDYALNVANDITARLLREAGMFPLTPSYDLNIDQLLDLLRAAPPEWFEVTVHQYMPMFHMEHCVFCRFLSDGTDASNCGRPCEKHAVALRDRKGYAHVLKADAGCRNTLFNAVAQSASAYLPALLNAGVRRFRIDFLDETPEAVLESIAAYLPAVRGEGEGGDLWKRLKANSKLGVTRGSLDFE